MIIFIRHSKDMKSYEASHFHDPKLDILGKKIAKQKSKEIIKKYGIPDYIFVSPFRRTLQTLDELMKKIPKDEHEKIKVIKDNRISRYFSKKDRKNADVHITTLKSNINTNETFDLFSERLDRALKDITDLNKRQKEPLIFVITHTSTIKKIGKHFDYRVKEYMEYMYFFEINYCNKCKKTHG